MTKEEMTANEEIKRLAAKYAKYGVTESMLHEIMQKPNYGLTVSQRLIGLRLLLGNEYGEQEYFSVKEVAEIMETDTDEALKMMLESGATPMTISIIPGGIAQ